MSWNGRAAAIRTVARDDPGPSVLAGSTEQLGLIEAYGVLDDRLEERAVGLVNIFVTRSEQHAATPSLHLENKLRDEPALPDPASPVTTNEQRLSGSGQRPPPANKFTLRSSADERRGVRMQFEGRRHRRVEVRERWRLGLEPGKLTSILGTELAQQRGDVDLHRAPGDGQLVGDFGVGEMLTDQSPHLGLATGDPLVVRPRRHGHQLGTASSTSYSPDDG